MSIWRGRRLAPGTLKELHIARTVLPMSGWRAVEAVDEPSAITALAPIDGADPGGAGLVARSGGS